MIDGTVILRFSIEDCFKINELIVANKKQSFKQSFRDDKYDINLLITMDKPKNSLSICLDDLACSCETTYLLKKVDDIQDFFGVYDYKFKYNGEEINYLILLTNQYDDKYFISIGECLISHLDSLTYKRNTGDYKMLLNYLDFYDIDNKVSLLFSLYILEMLYPTPYFKDADDMFYQKLIEYSINVKFYAYKYENTTLVENGLKVLDGSKSTGIEDLKDILIGMYAVRIKKKGSSYRLIKKSVNDKCVYNAIIKVLSTIKNSNYLYF